MDLPQLRAETPGAADHIHLNNAGSSLMPAPVVRTLKEHIDREARVGGYEAAAERQAEVQAAYESVATLVGARAENIAFTESATAAYVQALSSIPFAQHDVILTTRNDYVSNQIQFLSLQARLGVRVVRAADRPEGGVDLCAMADLIRRERPKLVCVTHVPTNSGLVQDIVAVGALCRAHDILYLVDACQSAGQMPIDTTRIGCDFLSVTFRKFMRGPRGTGFLYVSDRVLERGLEPLFIDYRGAEWVARDSYRPVPGAARFETWESAWALVLGAGEAARYAQRIGLDGIRDRVQMLARRLRNALSGVGPVRVLDHGPELCGIVSAAIDGRDVRELASQLRNHGISIGAQFRSVALIDYDEKGIAASIRLSPHYYNTEEEVDRAVAVIRDLL